MAEKISWNYAAQSLNVSSLSKQFDAAIEMPLGRDATP